MYLHLGNRHNAHYLFLDQLFIHSVKLSCPSQTMSGTRGSVSGSQLEEYQLPGVQ